jgi:hypothetical protein
MRSPSISARSRIMQPIRIERQPFNKRHQAAAGVAAGPLPRLILEFTRMRPLDIERRATPSADPADRAWAWAADYHRRRCTDASGNGSQTRNALAFGPRAHIFVVHRRRRDGVKTVTHCLIWNIGGERGITRAAPSPFGPPPLRGNVLRCLRQLRRTTTCLRLHGFACSIAETTAFGL